MTRLYAMRVSFVGWKVMSRKVIELIRVSTEAQAAADKASIPAQRASNRRTADVYGLEIVRSFEIADVSGAAVLHAPEMQELIELMRSPEIHGVVAKEFSRLMRPENFGDYILLQHFADTRTILYLPDGPIDLGSKMGRLIGGVRALFAGAEREEIRERVWAAKEEKRRRGENPQSVITLPFGVSYNREGGWVYTSDAEKVSRAFHILLSGEHSYSAIAKLTGIEPCNLRVILRNPIYSGWRVIDKKRDMSTSATRVKVDGRQGDRRKIMRTPEEVIRVKVFEAPLISEANFEQAQLLMDHKRKLHWRSADGRVSPYAYHGHLVCGVCNELVYTYSNARGGRYYVCKAKQYPRATGHKCASRYMRREEIERKLDSLMGSRLTDSKFLHELAEEHIRREKNPAAEASLVRIRAEGLKLQTKRERIMEAFFDGVITAEERDQRRAAVDAALNMNNSLLAAHSAPEPLTALVLSEICSVFLEWNFLTVAQKRRVLASTLPEIRVADCEVQGITLNLPGARHGEMTRRDTDSSPPPA